MAFVDFETSADMAAREALLDRAFGPERLRKTCERLREGRLPAAGLSFVLREGGRLLGSLRFWHLDAGGVPALMLGPLAVDPAAQGGGHGKALMEHGLAAARALGHGAVLLVGDAPFYGRWGFAPQATRCLLLPGPVARERFLALEFRPGALARACGAVRATGAIPLRGAARGKARKAA